VETANIESRARSTSVQLFCHRDYTEGVARFGRSPTAAVSPASSPTGPEVEDEESSRPPGRLEVRVSFRVTGSLPGDSREEDRSCGGLECRVIPGLSRPIGNDHRSLGRGLSEVSEYQTRLGERQGDKGEPHTR
jgi:hypothetical protein